MQARLLVLTLSLGSLIKVDAASNAMPVRPVVFEPTGRPSEFVSRSSAGWLRLTRSGIDFVSNRGQAVRIYLAGGRRVYPRAADLLPSVSHYYVGRHPAQWRTNVANYSQVRYQGVYQGIDLVVYAAEGRFEYDFVVSPGADPSSIRMRFAGAGRPKLNSKGDLILEGAGLVERRPRVFQGQYEVAGHFHLHRGCEVSFDLARYDHSRPLTIDPVITYLSFLGGRSADHAYGVSVDKAGNIYVAGSTFSTDFPGYRGLVQQTTGPLFAFVSKFAPVSNGKTQLLFTVMLGDNTYVNGRAGLAVAQGVSVDPSGNIVVAGQTDDLAFPTKNAFQSHLSNAGICKLADTGEPIPCLDGFLVKVKPDGSELTFSTYYGGSNDEDLNAVATDSLGGIYVAGQATAPTSLQGTSSAIQTNPAGDVDMLVARFDANGTLLYATLLGGSAGESARAIAVEKPGVVWVGGDTSSKDMPMPAARNGFQTSYPGRVVSAYLARIDMNQAGASGLTYATYFNGELNTDLWGLSLDPSGQVIFCGGTVSLQLPTTANALEPQAISLPPSEVSGPDFTSGDGYVARINPNLSGSAGLTYSSYVGGSHLDQALACGLDLKGNLVVAGNTLSTDLFIQNGSPLPRKITLGGSGTMPFLIRIDPNKAGAAGLVDSIAFGGTQIDFVNTMAIDERGYAYLTGMTRSKDLPVTAGAVQRGYGGDDVTGPQEAGYGDAFLAQVDLSAPAVAAAGLIQESGDFQFAAPGSPLPAPIAVHLADSAGNPLRLSGYPVDFTGVNATVTDKEVLTDGEGVAKTTAQISGDATVSTAIKLTGFPAQAYVFHFKAVSGVLPNSVAIVSGDKQSGSPGAALSSPLVVELRDAGNAPLTLAGLTVQFKPVNASVGSATAVTDTAGRATTTVKLGPNTGPASVQVVAGSLPLATATFTVSGSSVSAPLIGPDGLQSAATYKKDAVSPGLVGYMKGSNFGPADLVVNAPGADGKYSTALAQTRVLFDGVPGAMIYTSTGQLSVIVPYEVDGKAFTNVQVEYQGVSSASLQVPVAGTQLGLFSADSSGRGQAAILNQDNSINSAANPAKRASIVVLFGTGEGQTNPAGVDGQTAQSVYPKPKQPITAKVNGIEAEVAYYGAAPTLVAGVIQVNVKIPAGVADGDAIVQILEGSSESPATVTVAVKGDQ